MACVSKCARRSRGTKTTKASFILGCNPVFPFKNSLRMIKRNTTEESGTLHRSNTCIALHSMRLLSRPVHCATCQLAFSNRLLMQRCFEKGCRFWSMHFKFRHLSRTNRLIAKGRWSFSLCTSSCTVNFTNIRCVKIWQRAITEHLPQLKFRCS